MSSTVPAAQSAWPNRPWAIPRAASASLFRLAVSGAAGAALALAHEHESLYALALLAIGAFFWTASTTLRRSSGFLQGVVFGLSCFAIGLSWLFDLLERSEAPLAATLLPALLIAALSLPYGIVGAALAAPKEGRARRMFLVAPALWVGFDWLRHQGDAAFPWFSVGYSQVPASPLAGYAPVGGVLLVGFVTVLVAALVVAAATRRDVRIRAALTAAALLLVGSLLQYVPWTTAVGDPVRVAVLQANIGAETKFDRAALPRTLARYESLIRSASADVIVTPESALPLPPQELRAYLSELASHARRTGTDVLIGTVEIDSDSGHRYSSAIGIGPSGIQMYRKRQLVPFGDFVPAADALYRSVQRIPFANTTRGNADQDVPILANGRVAVVICYDDAFGGRMRADAAAAGWIANLGNDGWGGSQAMQRQHARIAQTRALEFGRPQLRATDTGRSGLIDERGRWVDALPPNEVGVLEAAIVLRSGITPYAWWGDRAALVTCLLALLAALVNRGSASGAAI